MSWLIKIVEKENDRYHWDIKDGGRKCTLISLDF